jgi:hypothetical protein
MRRSPKVTEGLPILYLRELSTGDFPARPSNRFWVRTSPACHRPNIARLTDGWEKEYADFRQCDLSGRDYVYVWVDGSTSASQGDDRLCTW